MVSERGDIQVEQVTLDEYCARHGLRPTVMKVDIEGGEAAALEDSEVARAVRKIVVEVHAPQLAAEGVDPDAFLAGLGEHEHLGAGNYAVRPHVAA